MVLSITANEGFELQPYQTSLLRSSPANLLWDSHSTDHKLLHPSHSGSDRNQYIPGKLNVYNSAMLMMLAAFSDVTTLTGPSLHYTVVHYA